MKPVSREVLFGLTNAAFITFILNRFDKMKTRLEKLFVDYQHPVWVEVTQKIRWRRFLDNILNNSNKYSGGEVREGWKQRMPS